MRASFSLLFSQILAVATAQVTVDVISGVLADGASNVQFTSPGYGFDAAKVKPLNGSTFDWWYFDVVSSDATQSLVLVFFNAGPNGLAPGTASSTPSAVWATAGITLPDGSSLNGEAFGEDLTVVTVDNGSSGNLNGTGWGWVGSSDMSQYVIAIDSPASGVQGVVDFQSIAPAHFPCAPIAAAAGQSYALAPEFGWANSIPDANAVVDLTINGTQVTFSGSGYHDKNWGSAPTSEVVQSWYWGHGRLGPISIVWFWALAPDGTETVSSYVASNGKAQVASCSGMTVRPTGANDVFPPVLGNAAPGGFHVSAEVEGEGTLEIDVTHKQLLSVEPGVMYRWIGTVSGGFGNGTNWTGPALYEQFTF